MIFGSCSRFWLTFRESMVSSASNCYCLVYIVVWVQFFLYWLKSSWEQLHKRWMFLSNMRRSCDLRLQLLGWAPTQVEATTRAAGIRFLQRSCNFILAYQLKSEPENLKRLDSQDLTFSLRFQSWQLIIKKLPEIYGTKLTQIHHLVVDSHKNSRCGPRIVSASFVRAQHGPQPPHMESRRDLDAGPAAGASSRNLSGRRMYDEAHQTGIMSCWYPDSYVESYVQTLKAWNSYFLKKMGNEAVGDVWVMVIGDSAPGLGTCAIVTKGYPQGWSLSWWPTV